MTASAEVVKDLTPESLTPPRLVEEEGLRETPATHEVSSDVSQYVQKVEQNPTAVVNSDDGAPVLTPTGVGDVEITVPMSAEQIKEGLKHPVVEGIYWLARQCRRWTKQLVGRRKV